MTFEAFRPPGPGTAGFTVVAGREHGLDTLLVAAGRLPSGDVGPVHVHEGDEVLRVVSGEIVVRLGDQERVCGPDDLVVVPGGTEHGFRVVTETALEVVAAYDIGTLYPVRTADGRTELVEVHRQDMPWGRPPPQGGSWTTDAEMAEVLARLRYVV